MVCEIATNKLEKLLIHLNQVNLTDIDFERLWVFNTNELSNIELQLKEIKERIINERNKKAKYWRDHR